MSVYGVVTRRRLAIILQTTTQTQVTSNKVSAQKLKANRSAISPRFGGKKDGRRTHCKQTHPVFFVAIP